MKVKNTSRRVIKLMNGKEKVTLVPGTGETYDVTDNADVRYMIEAGDLTEVAERNRKAETNEVAGGRKPMTVAEIKGALLEKEIPIPEGVTKRDDLLALLEGAETNDEK